MLEKGTHPLPFFWKCVKRKGFKSFVLKVCETKGFADTFLRKCINLKELAQKVGAQGWLGADLRLPTGTVVSLCSSPSNLSGQGLLRWRSLAALHPSGRLAITTQVRIPQLATVVKAQLIVLAWLLSLWSRKSPEPIASRRSS